MDTRPAGYQVEQSQQRETGEERRFNIPPGAVVLFLGVLLIGVIVVGIILNRDAGASVDEVTIAELRADPDRYDNQIVELNGTAENVRELPYLTQYAVYTMRDETGTMLVLTQKGAPPDTYDGELRLKAIYHARVTLDDELRRIVEEQFGEVVASIITTLLPDVPLNVVFLEHQGYDMTDEG